MKKILFVCTGNTCRSPMAEWIFKNKIESSVIQDWDAISAGIGAFDGDDISEYSAEVLKKEWGIHSLTHRSRRIKKQMLEEVDFILTMTRSHSKSIESNYPEAEGKVYTLKEFAKGTTKNMPDSEVDIGDPFGMDYEEYIRVAKEIEEAIDTIVHKLKEQIESV